VWAQQSADKKIAATPAGIDSRMRPTRAGRVGMALVRKGAAGVHFMAIRIPNESIG
jgi:hypothetical protein